MLPLLVPQIHTSAPDPPVPPLLILAIIMEEVEDTNPIFYPSLDWISDDVGGGGIDPPPWPTDAMDFDLASSGGGGGGGDDMTPSAGWEIVDTSQLASVDDATDGDASSATPASSPAHSEPVAIAPMRIVASTPLDWAPDRALVVRPGGELRGYVAIEIDIPIFQLELAYLAPDLGRALSCLAAMATSVVCHQPYMTVLVVDNWTPIIQRLPPTTMDAVQRSIAIYFEIIPVPTAPNCVYLVLRRPMIDPLTPQRVESFVDFFRAQR